MYGPSAGTKWPLWTDGGCTEVKIRVNVWTVRQEKWPLWRDGRCREVLNNSECMDRPPGTINVAAVERMPLVKVSLNTRQLSFYCNTCLDVVGYIKRFSSSQATYGTGSSETHGDPAMAIMDIFILKWAITCVVSKSSLYSSTPIKRPPSGKWIVTAK